MVSMQVLRNYSALLSVIGLSAIHEEFLQKLTEIVVRSDFQRRLDTIIYVSYENDTLLRQAGCLESSTILQKLAIRQGKPVFNVDYTPAIERLRYKFNMKMLSIVKLTLYEELDTRLLTTLWQRLWQNTQTRLVLLFDDLVSGMYIKKILLLCAKHKAVNLIALQPRLTAMEHSYWTLRLFPILSVTKHTFPNTESTIFPTQQQNMYGRPLRINAPKLGIQAYEYKPRKGGPPILSGFLGRALAWYASHYNATIEYVHNIDQSATQHNEINHLIESGVIDIGPMVPMVPQVLQKFNVSLSNPLFTSNFCFMIPIGQRLPKSEFYLKIVHKYFICLFLVILVMISAFCAVTAHWQKKQRQTIIDYIFQTSILGALLGLPVWLQKECSRLHKIIFITTSYVGIIIGTAYSAYLQSFSMNAPIARTLKTYEDLIQHGIKMALGTYELMWINSSSKIKNYQNYFVKFANITEYNERRDRFDTNYAFGVTDKWSVYEEQQKYFTRPVFRLSNICLERNYPMVVVVQENSLFLESFNALLLRLQEGGLMNQWRRRSFWEYLDMHLISVRQDNSLLGFQSLKLADVKLIFFGLCFMMLMSILCFILENNWARVRSIFLRVFKNSRN